MPPRFRPLSLPQVPLSQQLTSNLIPDPVTPDAKALISSPTSFPSLLRRSRIVRDGAHFSYVTPLPLPFPYEFLPYEQGEESEGVERFLSSYEPPNCREFAPARQHPPYPSARLVAFSPQAHAACVPHLNVGDTHEWIQQTSGKSVFSSGPLISADTSHLYGSGEDASPATARQALSDWASGRAFHLHVPSSLHSQEIEGIGVHFLTREEDDVRNTQSALSQLYTRTSYGPWSLRYGGHQFGEWAGQLGDGRTVSLVETLHPDSGQRMEIQIKGAGRTPYSRFADGLATLKSSTREFLVSEYMAALGIPTSYSLCVVSLPDVPVLRETRTTAALNMRIAPSWLRIGNFQLHSIRNEWESVRVLGEYVARELYGWSDVIKGEGVSDAPRPPWALRLVKEAGVRNAKTFALWQVYGFMHGVINTDNISLLGDTIDYGPYAFMDAINEDEICNHSDVFGRYSYKMQPTMLVYAVDKLFEALAPLIGFEDLHERALRPGELLHSSVKERQAWADHAESYLDEVRALVQTSLLKAWAAAWATRLGVEDQDVDRIKYGLIDPFFRAFAGWDLSRSLRTMCDFPTYEGDVHSFAERIARDAATKAPHAASVSDLAAWLETYRAKLTAEGRPPSHVAMHMKRANPRFVLRNWITDLVAEQLASSNDTKLLERVRAMCAAPFEAYDAPDDASLCEVGELLQSNTPSCSS